MSKPLLMYSTLPEFIHHHALSTVVNDRDSELTSSHTGAGLGECDTAHEGKDSKNDHND